MALTTVRPQGMGFVTGRRNVVINGAMQVAQRGTSETGVGGSAGYCTVDRFDMFFNNTAGRLTQSQADVTDLSGFQHALKLDCTTADTSIASDEVAILQYAIEGQDLQQFKKGYSDAESFTVSFYVKGNASATYTIELQDNDNSRQNTQTFDVTTGWTRVTKTFAADTTGKFDNDNAASLRIQIYLQAGSTYTSGTFTSNTWATLTNANTVKSDQTMFFDSTDRELFITGLQLELGENASDFEHRSFGEELALCKRYYQRWESTGTDATSNKAIGAGVWHGTTQVLAAMSYDVEMRAAPTMTLSPTDGLKAYGGGFAEARSGGNGLDTIGTKTARINFTVSTTRTAGQGTMIQIKDSGDTLEADAEL